jgi:hypothetical protein
MVIGIPKNAVPAAVDLNVSAPEDWQEGKISTVRARLKILKKKFDREGLTFSLPSIDR